MRRTATTLTAAAILALAACSSTSSKTSASGDQASSPTVGISTVKVISSSPSAPATTPAPKPTTAAQVAALLVVAIPQAKKTATYTESSDPNHLLGRPHQYLSKVELKDSRIKASDVMAAEPGDLQYGASVEVFANHADAQHRSDYIQQVTANMPAAMEYDYIAGNVLIRVSHYLTPTQAKDYEKFAKSLA